MKYQIIRIKDGEVIEADLTKEEAEKKLFFYDTEENPHKMVKQESKHPWQS